RREGVLRFRRRAEIDRGAGAVAQLEMTGDEVGVEVGEEDVRDAQAVRVGEGQVLIDVALRGDDGCGAGLLVADQVRRVREAIQIELVEDHVRRSKPPAQYTRRRAPPRRRYSFGW